MDNRVKFAKKARSSQSESPPQDHKPKSASFPRQKNKQLAQKDHQRLNRR